MADLCFYFHVHQPLRLARYSAFNPEGNPSSEYFDFEMNKHYFRKAAENCYLPANRLLKKLALEKGFKCSYSISGVFLEQCEAYGQDVLQSFQELVDTKSVSLVQETYYHSLSSLYPDLGEFREQVKMHGAKLQEAFGVKPRVFRNTELLFDNRIAVEASRMGFRAILAEGVERVLGWRSPNYAYRSKHCPLRVFLRNYKLSDDIGFRFSSRGWSEWPLTADKFASWVGACEGQTVNLFMDYETFGEHHWRESGIFEFIERLPDYSRCPFVTLEEMLKHEPVGEIDAPHSFSWADLERDASAWLGNGMQHACFAEVQGMEGAVKGSKSADALMAWRKLQTSDHFMYLSTKGMGDGSVHHHFSPYKHNTAFENYANFMNILIDLRQRLGSGGGVPAQRQMQELA